MQHRKASRSARPPRRRQRCVAEPLESRILLSGANEQALLSAIDAALQPNDPSGLSGFNSLFKGSTALGSNLPVIGGGLSAYDPGQAISGLLARLGSNYASVSALVTALDNGPGITVTSSSDLLNNIELDVDFTTTSVVDVPVNANYGVTFVDPGTLTMATTLTENLSLGSYWDPNTSSAVFYVDVANSSIAINSTATSFFFAPSTVRGQLGFLDFSTPKTSTNLTNSKLLSTTVSFAPTFSFQLSEQPPADSAQQAGRDTLAQLFSVPFTSLVSAALSQPAAATLTAGISTSLSSSAKQIVFTWPDINKPTDVTSTLATDPTLATLNALQSIAPAAISAGLDEVAGDFTAAATDGSGGAGSFNTDLPLIDQSAGQLADFLGGSSVSPSTGAFYPTYLTHFTDSSTNSFGAASSPFLDDEQLLQTLTALGKQSAPTNVQVQPVTLLNETSNGTELIFTFDLDVMMESTAPVDINVQPALNLTGLPALSVTTSVNTEFSFGVDGASGNFFVVDSSQPAVQVNVNASYPGVGGFTGTATLGYLAVNVSSATLSLAASASVTLTDPKTNNPSTPGITTAAELISGLQQNGVNVPVPATEALSGLASANIPVSVFDGLIPGAAPATINISWANVSATNTYTFNTANLTPYIGFNNVTPASVFTALSDLPTVLGALSDSSQFGRDFSFFGSSLGTTITLGNSFQTRTGFDSANAANAPGTFQALVFALDADFGQGNVVLSTTSDGVEIGLSFSQQFSGSTAWGVSHPMSGMYFAASGTTPISATYAGTLDFGMVLTGAATPANQFYLLGGPGGSSVNGAVAVNAGLNGPAQVGSLPVTISGGSAVVGITGQQPGTSATISLPLGTTAGQRLTLGNPPAKPDSFYGNMNVNGGVELVLPLSGLPNPGSNPRVTVAWVQLASPSSVVVTPSNLGSLSTANSFSASNISSGLGALETLLGELQTSPVAGTNLYLLGEPTSSVINYISYFQSALTRLESAASGANSPSALNTAITGASLGTGVSVTPTANNNPSGNQFEYTLAFNVTQPTQSSVPFNFQSGVDSTGSALNVTLAANLPITASFTGSLTFGYDPGDGFYVYGGNGSPGLQADVQVSTTATFANQTIGTFGQLPFGVSGGSAGLSAELGLSLNSPGENGQKISTMDLTTGGTALLAPTLTGSGTIDLPFGLHLGSGGPGVISSFSANWDPTRAQPVEYGASNAMTLSGGFGDVYFDYTEFVEDMLGPVLQQIASYDPIPPELLSALSYEIPIIDETPLQILQSQGDYSTNDDVSTLVNILSLISQMPAGANQLDLSDYLPGAPATGDTGATDGDVGGNFSDFKSFVTDLESDTNNVVTVPVLDNTQQAIVNTLLGQDTTLIQFNTGPFNLTASTDAITILPSTPVFDLGIASVNLSITGGASISLSGDIDIGLSDRGLIGKGLLNSSGPDLIDGFFINDAVGTSFGGSAGVQQIALQVNAHVTITGSLDLGGFLSVASISGSLGPYGEVGVRVNSLVPNANNTGFLPNPNAPTFLEIAGYNGAPAGNGMAYFDEIQYIANNYGPLCAVMPDAQLGLQLTISATVGDPPLGFSFTVVNQQFPIANFDFPCEPVTATLAQVVGNALVMTPNVLSTSDGQNTISASVYYNPTNQNQALGIGLVESNQNQIFYQDIPFAQLAGVNTLVMNGTSGNDTFNFDPNLTETTINSNNYTGTGAGTVVSTPNPAPIEFLQINTLDGNDTAKLNNLTPQNSQLQGLTIVGGNGNDFFQGTYCPDGFDLGNGNNTAEIGTGNGMVVETGGDDTISGGNGNDTVVGGSGESTITLGDGNNVVQQGPGIENVLLGNGKNLVTASTLSFTAGIAANGSPLGNPPAPVGTQAAYIQGNSLITQLITSNWSPSNTYTMSFEAAAAANDATTGGEQIQVLVDNQVVDTIDPTSTAYQTFTTPSFSVSSLTGGLNAHQITFRGLDPSEGNNTVFISNVLLGGGLPLPQIMNPSFSSPTVTGGTTSSNDIAPFANELNPTDTSFDFGFGPGWVYIAGIGVDTVIAGNGQDTIHGSIGGSTIFVGNGQDIIYQSGTGAQFINAGGLPNTDSQTAGGGNDFIAINPASGGAYTVNGGSGRTLLEVQGGGNMALNNQGVSVGVGAGATVNFANISTVSLTGETPGLSFDVSHWTGNPVQINGIGSGNTIVSTDDVNFTLTDGSLSRSDGTSFALGDISNAVLTGGPADNSFDITGWHGSATLNGGGGNDTLIAGGLTSATLTNTQLQRTGAANITLNGLGQATLTTNFGGGANINASAFTGNTALLGEGNNNTLQGGAGSDYILGGTGTGNDLVGNGATDNELIGGAGSHDTLHSGAGENLLVSSNGGGDSITSGSGPSHVYTPGNNNTINVQSGSATVYNASTGNTVNTGSNATDTVLTPGEAGTQPSDFTAPSTADLWEFPTLPVPPTATLPSGTAALGQWVEIGASASGGGVSSSTGSAIEPAIVATGSGASAVQYLTWADNRSGTYQIFVAADTASGWKELAGSAHGGGISNSSINATQPSIALDSSGNPMVAWTEGGNIFVADYNPSANGGNGGWVAFGTSLGAGGISNTGHAASASIAESSTGPVVAWLDTSGGAANVYVKTFNGSTWSPLASGSASGSGVSASASAIANFSLAVNGSTVAVAWAQPGTAAGGSIYIVQDSGAGFAGLNGSASGNGISGGFAAEEPSIAYSGGSLYAAWAANTDGTSNIVAAVNGASGFTPVSISTPSTPSVNQTSRGAASDPVLSSNGTSLDLIWIEDRLPAAPDQAVAIYANRLSGGAFVDQLPGDSSFDGILGRPTSLSQPAQLALAVDAAGHPFAAWGDTSSGSSQVYMLGDTLNVAKVFYVNDTLSAQDSYTTASGSAAFNGLTPATPLDSVADVFKDYTIASADVILVDSGSYAGFTIGAAQNGVIIIGSPGGTTHVTGAVNVSGAQNITLQSLELSGGASLTGGTNVQLTGNTGGALNALPKDEGGSVTISGGANVTLDGNALVGVTFTGSSSSNATLINNNLPGEGLSLGAAVTGLLAENNRMDSLSVDAASQGTVAANNISGGGVAIESTFTGAISGNFIHNANVGVDANAAAPLNGNVIFDNKTGVIVTAGSGGVGENANAVPNQIVSNGVGVNLGGTMQGQFIGHNDVGVTGSGVLGGSLLADANQIDGNTLGVDFQGTIQYNRIDYNGASVVVQNGQIIAHNLFYDNNSQNLETLGASNVEVFNNTFFAPNTTNILVDGASSDVEIINNILWTGGGYDLDIATDSRTGYFSDYNDLYTTGSGLIVHYLVDFSDILDWQDDVALYDLHSIGTTVVNPTAAQPQFVNLGFGDFFVYPAAAGIRKTSPTVATGDPESDIALPAVQYTNELQNPSFENGVTDWTVNPGGTTQSGDPTAFDGNSYFYSGAVASGFAQQTISLLSDGFTAGQIDAGTLDVSFGGRIQSAPKTTPDQGQIELTFLDGSGNVIGTPTLVSATNTTNRWELVGARVHVPVGARSVVYRFQSLRESGSTDQSYLDAAFLYVLANSFAPDMGAYGNSTDTAESSDDEKIQLQTPDLYVNWTLTQSHNILWSTFDNTGDDPVEIDLYQQTAGGLQFVTNITESTPDTGVYAWIPQDSGLTYGTYNLKIKVSLVGQSAINDISTETFTVPENGNTYYINDGSTSGDQYTTAAGNNRATGKIPSAPLPLLTTLLREYTLGATDTVYVDNGTYFDFAPVELSGNPALGSGQGVTILGPTAAGDEATINALGFTSPAVIDVNDASFVSISNIGADGGSYGFWVRNTSSNFTGVNLSASNNLLGGFRIEADSSAQTSLNGVVTSNNAGDGVFAGGAIVSLINSNSFDNTGDGFDLANAGGAVLTDDTAEGNKIGLNIGNSTGGTTSMVGNANLSLGLGNQFFNNTLYGIQAVGGVMLAGNTVNGQTANNDAGINLGGGQIVTENVVYGNYNGIVSGSGGSLTFNNVYSNANVGIEGDAGADVFGNTSDQNGIGIQSFSAPNSSTGPFINNNLVFENTQEGIVLVGGNGAQINNNTVYQLVGDAVSVAPDGSLNSANVQIENNILWTLGAYDLQINPSSTAGFKSDYNDLYVTGTGQVGQWQNFAEATLNQWNDASNNDADSISTDPLFVNLAGGDFHVQSTTGSFHGGSLAPILGGNGLPAAAPGTLTADASESPTIDRGDPAFSFASEPPPNGAFINLGNTGNTSQASLSPTSYVLVLKPAAAATLIEGQSFTITWRSQNTSGTANIDLLQGATVVTNIATGVANSGSYLWSIPNTLTPGNYTIRVTRNAAPTAVGVSGVFTLSAPINNYYVNEASTGGVFTTAGGSDGNSGLDPAHPKATIQALLSAYAIGANSIIYVDEGTYNLTGNLVLTSVNNGVTIEGVPGGGTILNRGNQTTGDYDFDVQGVANATIEDLTLTGGFYGINAGDTNGAVTNLTVSDCTFFGDISAGINLQNNVTTNTGDLITGNVFHNTAPAPTILQSSFSTTPNQPDKSFSTSPAGSDWSFSGGAGIATGDDSLVSSNSGNGQQLAVLPNTGSFSQTINGWGAGSYALNIAAAQLAKGNNGGENFEVLIDGQLISTITPTSASYATYTTNEFTVLPGAHTITLTGLDTAGGSNTALINGISFVGLPINSDGLISNDVQFNLTNNIAYSLSYGFQINSGDGTTASGNTAYDDSIGIAAANAVLTGNITYNDTDGIAFNGTSLSGNTSYDNTGVGINIASGIALDNIAYGNPVGIEITGAAIVQDNLVYNNTTAGIEGGNGSQILGNVVYGNGIGISTSSDPSAAEGGPTIENNLVYNNTNTGISLFSGDDTPVLNNTVYQTSGNALQIASAQTSNILVRDNILWDTAGADISIGAAAEQNVTFDYNDLWITGTGQIGIFGSTSYPTLFAWQDATGMDEHSISADPLFVNLAGDDFHVQATNGSFHGGSLAPTLNTATGLPNPPSPGTLTDDANESPTIDRGSPADPYTNEPAPNGAYVNLGSYGNTSQASLSPAHFLFVITPAAGQTAATGQPVLITWRDEETNTAAGAAATVRIDILQQGNSTPVQSFTEPDTGAFTWPVPANLTAGQYQVRITRNDSTGLVATSGVFNVAVDTNVYYVNGAATGGVLTTAGGNDANNGLTPATPKATIANVLQSYTLTPGAIIMVDEATYNLSANLVLTAADSGITIEGVAGATILNRGNLNGGAYDLDLQGATNLTLENLTFTGGDFGMNANSGENINGLTITDCLFTGDEEIGVFFGGNNGDITVTGSTFDNMVGPNGIYGLESSGNNNALTLTGNTAFDLGIGFYISIGNVTNTATLISNNTAYQNDTGFEIGDGSNMPVLVTNNTAYDNFDQNLYVGGGGLTASGNTVYEDGGAGKNESSSEEGILLTPGGLATNNNVYGNVIGIYLGSQTTATFNNIHNNSSYGIDATSNPEIISGNTIDSNGSWGIAGLPTSVTNNLIYANTSGGMYFVNTYDASFTSNTVYETTGPAIRIDGLRQNGPALPSITVQNNILWDTAAADLLVDDAGELSFSATPSSDYNDLYATGSGEIASFGGQNFTSLSAFAEELGLDTHSISADPQFINAASGNFHVQPASPTIDAGNPASEFISEPQPNGGRINLGYDGDTPQAATSSSATTLQVTSPSSLNKLQVGVPATITWLTSGVEATQTLTQVGAGLSSPVGEYHAAEFQVGSQTTSNNDNTAVNTSLVTNPAPQAVYQTFAEAASGIGATLSYLIPVPNGAYTIRLDFAEPDVGSVGGRTFDISLNGQVVQSAFDIYSAAGKSINKAVALTFTVTAANGSGIALTLKNDTANPAILNGFEVSQANPGGTAGATANVQVSANNGSSWMTIAANVPMDAEGRGSLGWIPTAATADALIRVIANTTAATTGVSSAFTVAPAGNIFYVNGPSTLGAVFTTAPGNNANNGKTPATPMASIEAVLNTYTPGAGDVIEVDNGTYTLFHDIDIPAADSGVTITGPASGGTAIINRNNIAIDDYVFAFFDGADNVTIEHLSITGGYSGINASEVNLGIDNITIAYNQIYSNDGSGYSGGITSSFNLNWLIVGNTIHDNNGGFSADYGIELSSTSARILDNTVFNEPEYDIFLSAANNTPVSANLVSGNTVFGTEYGIAASGATVANNFAHDNTIDGIVGASNSLVTGNTVWRQTATNAAGILDQGGVVSNNRVYGNYIGIDGAPSGELEIYDNSVYSNLNYGMEINASTGNFTTTPQYAYDNLVYANSVGGIEIINSLNFQLIGNTVYQLVGDALNLSGTANPLTIESNILWVEAGYDIDVTSTSAQTGLISDYNILYHTGANARVGLWNGTPQATLANWQAASSLDAHSSEANPDFVNPAGADAVLGYNATANNGNGLDGGPDDDFSLVEGSPAIDAGQSWLGLASDIQGNPRVDDAGTPNTGSPDYLPAVQSSSLFNPTSGTAINLRTSSPEQSQVSLPFTFSFYGTNYTTIDVSSTGAITLGSFSSAGDTSANSNAALEAVAMIAPLWGNLETNQTGDNVFVDTTVANQITIRWAATNVANGAAVNFAVVLFSNGQIRFDYGAGNTGLTPTIGISKGDGQHFKLTSYDGQSTLTNADSILFTLPPGYVDIGAYEYHGAGSEFIAPTITSGNAATFVSGQANAFLVTTTFGLPATTSLSETGALPAGVSLVDLANGSASLAGVPTGPAGTYQITLSATAGSNTSTQNFTLTVIEAPTITSGNSATFTTGQTGSFTVTSSAGFPVTTTFTETGALPTGVSLTSNGNGTATLTGTPAAGTAGVYVVTINASSTFGSQVLTASQPFSLTVLPSALSLNSNVLYVRLDADGQHVDIWNNATASGAPQQSVLLSTISSLNYAGPAGGDSVYLDFSAGNPLPLLGISLSGGAGANALALIGTSAASSADAVNIAAGSFTVPAGLPPGTTAYTLGSVTIAPGAELMLAPSDILPDQTILTVSNLTVAGTLDISDNTLAIDYGGGPDPSASVQAALMSGYNNNAWNGPGIDSSFVAASNHTYTLAYVDGSVDTGTPAKPGQILVRYTLPGDANLDGSVGFADLVAVAENFGQTGRDYSQGDSTYAAGGSIGFADLVLVAENFGKSLAVQPAPAVSSFTVNSGAAQRATVQTLEFVFSQPVNLAPGAITLTQRPATAGGSSTPENFNLTNPSGDHQTYLMTFSGAGIVNGSLPDGVYDAVVHAALVTNASGEALSGGDQTYSFYRLTGDYLGNGTVGFGDLVLVAEHFGQTVSPGDPLDYLDINGDGTIGFADLVDVVENFGKSLSVN